MLTKCHPWYRCHLIADIPNRRRAWDGAGTPVEDACLKIAACILAKDEERNIRAVLEQLRRQSILSDSGVAIEIHVVSNGSTDSTVSEAAACSNLFDDTAASLHVHNLKLAGKSRAWNRAVHDLLPASADYIVFLDADITFIDNDVVADLVRPLVDDPFLHVCAGYPVKDVAAKNRKSLLDRLSLRVSSNTRFVDAISGQLYAVRATALKDIWLPDTTPGEDGFLNAMIYTCGFTREHECGRVKGLERPTHFFEALDPIAFLRHERRLIVGTIINRWIFEYLWSLKLSSSAGHLIRKWNSEDPGWVENIIRERVGNQSWLVPNAIVFGRLKGNHGRPLAKSIAFLPLALAATLLTIPPAIGANRRLKKVGAASTW